MHVNNFSVQYKMDMVTKAIVVILCSLMIAACVIALRWYNACPKLSEKKENKNHKMYLIILLVVNIMLGLGSVYLMSNKSKQQYY